MKSLKITAEQLHCPSCGTVIPKGHTRCPNPNCPTNKPIHSETGVKVKTNFQKLELVEL
jgi:aspartate carbamoyltransferase regulatory subunit